MLLKLLLFLIICQTLGIEVLLESLESITSLGLLRSEVPEE